MLHWRAVLPIAPLTAEQAARRVQAAGAEQLAVQLEALRVMVPLEQQVQQRESLPQRLLAPILL
jgi:hypothetical protein